MEPDLPFPTSTLLFASILHVDIICNRFRAALRGRDRPEIGDYLAEASDEDRPGLLEELITMEVQWRRRRGEMPAIEEYLARFSDASDAITAIFATSPSTDTQPTSGGDAEESEQEDRPQLLNWLGEVNASGNHGDPRGTPGLGHRRPLPVGSTARDLQAP